MRDEGLSLLLDFARRDAPEDPFAFRFAPQGYTLRTPGGGLDRVDVPWSAELLADLDALRGPDPEPAVVQRVGEWLAAVLRPAGWPALAAELLTASAAGRPVRVTLRSNAAELYALPWELLTVGASGQHLGELPRVLLRHAWPATETPAERPSPRPEGGRMLFAWSAAGGAVPASEHGQAIESSWSEGHLDRDPATDVVSHASAASLAHALKAAADAGEPYGLLHLLAHGGRRGSTSGLVLDGDDGRPHVVDAGRLRQLLAPFAASLRLVVIAACDGGDVGDPGNHLGSVAQALHRAGIQAVVASRYPLSVAGSTILAESLYRGLAVELRSLEDALLAARQRLAEEVATLDWAGLQLYARAEDGDDTRPIVVRPFRGLEVFEARHRRLLFGRDAEIAEATQEIAALRRADAPRIYLVSGASGSGKSSLVRAGLLPRLAPDFGAVYVARPDAADDPPPARPLLCVLDQAEEMFTTLDAGGRTRLLERLYALATDTAGSVVLMTLRADFSGRCGELVLPDGRRLDRLEADDAHRLFLPVMDRAALVAAITGPAARVGLPLDEGLADKLVDEVAGEPGSLPLLEFALDRLWLTRDPSRGLTHAGYRALGGAIGALLEREADAALDSMTADERTQSRRLLVQLVATGEGQRADTRRTRRLAELRPAAEADADTFDRALARLTAARLVVRSGAPEPLVEVAHEELIRRWGTLRGWVDADRQKWIEIERVRGWEHLLRGAQLDRAREARERYGDDLGQRCLTHIRESERVIAEESARERRRRLQLRVALGVAVVVAAVAVLLFFRAERATEEEVRRAEELRDEKAKVVAAKGRSEEAARRAEEAARRAKNAIRIAAARDSLAENDATTAALALSEVELAGDEPILGFLSTARDVRDSRESYCGSAVFLAEGERLLAAAFLEDEAHLITASREGVPQIVQVSTGAAVGPPLRHEGVRVAAFSPDGARAITASEKSAILWDVATGSQIGAAFTYDSPTLMQVVFSADGQLVLLDEGWTSRVLRVSTGALLGAGSTDLNREFFFVEGEEGYVRFDDSLSRLRSGALRSLRSKGGGSISEPMGGGSSIHHVESARGERLFSTSAPIFAFSGDMSRLLVSPREGLHALWRAERRPRLPLDQEGGSVVGLSFSPNGTRLLIAADNARAQLWSIDTGRPIGARLDAQARFTSAILSADGSLVLTASNDGARLWNRDTGALVRTLDLETGAQSASFSADSGLIVTTAENRAQLWRTSTGERVGAPLQHGEEEVVTSAAFAPDGARIATGSSDGSLHLWNVDAHRVEVRAHHHDGAIKSVSFSSRGGRLVSASADGTALIWELNAGAAIPSVPLRHSAEVVTAAFSRDDARVLTASSDGTARVWDATSGELIAAIAAEDSGRISSAAFSPDGELVATGTESGEVHLWDAQTGQSRMDAMWLRYLRACVRGCLPVAYRVERFGATDEEAREGLARCQERLRATAPEPS